MSKQNPYVRKGFLSRLPMWLKALFIKAWFAGAVFYFIGWGFFFQSRDNLDLILVLGLVHGLVTDIVVNKILIFIETEAQPSKKYVLCYSRRFLSILINLLFGIICAFLVAYTYNIANVLAIEINNRPSGYMTFGAEPIMYGLLYLAYETVFVVMKNTLVKIYSRARGL
ncbi:MAG: hypothetical protein FWE91_03090 [Defluviitaleaceae bacterium]|nr:hypothetical protein [Defluviitaleaceae bacterium]MCL2835910.1 hypothetical protein [Defluviitaleaceae bacterium]